MPEVPCPFTQLLPQLPAGFWLRIALDPLPLFFLLLLLLLVLGPALGLRIWVRHLVRHTGGSRMQLEPKNVMYIDLYFYVYF